MIEARLKALPPPLAADDILMVALDHWVGICDGLALPSAELIDPLVLPRSILPFVILADLEGDRIFFRLVGTAMCERWGYDFTGKHLDEIMTGEYGAYITGLFHRCRAEELPLFAESRFRWDLGRALWTRRLFLPYLRRAEQLIRVLVVQTFSGDEPNGEQSLLSLAPTHWEPYNEPVVLSCVRDWDGGPSAQA
jgi:hypothetical protein